MESTSQTKPANQFGSFITRIMGLLFYPNQRLNRAMTYVADGITLLFCGKWVYNWYRGDKENIEALVLALLAIIVAIIITVKIIREVRAPQGGTTL
jgi:hypothetical protein